MLVWTVTVLVAVLSLAEAGKYTVTDEVWFEVAVKNINGAGDDFTGKFTIALFGETAPMTSMNIAAIARGYATRTGKLTYKNTPIHRVVTDFVIQMGDITHGDGTGGRSIYGERFNDEEFALSHRSPGWVAMANQGPDSNGSQFYILLTPARWLDKKHVVFGKVVRGMKVVRKLGELEVDDNSRPLKEVKITDCGVNTLGKHYELSPEHLDVEDDIKPKSV